MLNFRNQNSFLLHVSVPRFAARYYTTVFNYVLPIGALLMIPVVGFCLSELGFVATYFILAILHLLFCVANAYDQPPLQLQASHPNPR